MVIADGEWEDPVAADLRALGRPVPTRPVGYESVDPVEAGAPDLPAEVIDEVIEPEVELPAEDEFVCPSCFLVQHRSRRSAGAGAGVVCLDCR